MKPDKKKNEKKLTNLDKIHNFLTKNKLIVIIIILVSLITSILTIYQFFKESINNSGINNQNATLINSPIIQKSSNISITYNQPPEENVLSPFYSTGFIIDFDTPATNGKIYNNYFVKFILPDDKEVFMEEVLFNKSYEIARCNEQLTDCYVYHKFEIKTGLKEDNICWIFTTRFGHSNISTDSMKPANRFFIDPKSCSKLVNE